ncbi:hypothetical protein JCM14469_32510 [Desulfatiferula olefinivorans]
MDKTFYRLIFEGLRQEIKPEKMLACLKESLGFSDGRIREILTSPPRVLTMCEGEAQISRLRHQIEAAGGRSRVEAMVNDDKCPFPVSRDVYTRIGHEMAKAKRGGYSFVFFSVHLVPDSENSIVPSLLNGIRERIEDNLDPTAAVLIIDGTRLVVLDFFSDRIEGLHTLETLDRTLEKAFGDTSKIFRGMAVFPDDGPEVSDLFREAEKKTRVMVVREKHEEGQDEGGRLSLGSLIKDSESPLELYQQILIGARGKKFQWLTRQNLETLWLGLGSMPQVRQWEFLYRLPMSSPLIEHMERAITGRFIAPTDADSRRRIEEVLIKLSGFDHDDRFTDMKRDIPVRLKRVSSFPTLSKVAATIVTLARDPDSNLDQLTAVIKNDPALTLTLLKIVNSAFYGFPQKIETIERAVIILGRDELIHLALGLGAAKAIDQMPANSLYRPQALWHHLMGTALICRFLYRRYMKKDDPGLFTAGLLHDFGKIFLVEHYPEAYDAVHVDAVEHEIPLYELEEECFGINHAIIGKHIGSTWNLPEALVQAAAYHHQPFFATEHTHLAAVIGFADFLYHKACPAVEPQQMVTECAPGLTFGHWHIIRQVFPGIVMDDIDILARECEAMLDENRQVFSLLA